MNKTAFQYLNRFGLLNGLSDEAFIRIAWKALSMPTELDLDNPTTYNEKLQWMKLHDRNPRYTKLTDKYEVKNYVASVIGEKYVIPTLGVWDTFSEIGFDKLPDRFVLKCTHDSGGVAICRNRKEFNRVKAAAKLTWHLRHNFYYRGREWPYKDVKPRILAEEYLENAEGENDTDGLTDYKFFVFDGEVKALFIATDRSAKTETCFDFYDRDFHHLPFTNGHPNAKRQIVKPENYEEMVSLAEKLGNGFPHVRIDLYNVKGRIYFGEYTFFHWSGFVPFDPPEWDYRFGDWITLPKTERALNEKNASG